MTDSQKQNIEKMRLQGVGYKRIGGALGLPVSTVKSFCQRNKLESGTAPAPPEAAAGTDICKHCGKPLEHTPKHRAKTFCSDKCRFAWHNARFDARRSFICAHCGAVFITRNNRSRKYCGHPCYILHHFGEEPS